MSIEEQVLEKLRELPPEHKREVLDFVAFLHQKHTPVQNRGSLYGVLADLGPAPTAEEIDEARREMWGNFPRNDI